MAWRGDRRPPPHRLRLARGELDPAGPHRPARCELDPAGPLRRVDEGLLNSVSFFICREPPPTHHLPTQQWTLLAATWSAMSVSDILLAP
jgi:hypothetical protein